MEQANIFTQINHHYYQLTSSEKKVADFILEQPKTVQYMSISELAQACGVADATISRFCRALQFKSYSTFRLAIAHSTAEQTLTTYSVFGEIEAEDSISTMSKKLYNMETEALKQTFKSLKPKRIEKAATILLQAKRVLCMGQGGSMLMAQEAAHLFTTAYPNYQAVHDSHLQSIATTHLTADDAVLYFSYSGATKDLLTVLNLVRQRKAKIILITRFPHSPGSKFADVVLECGSNENPLQLGSVAARIAQLYLIDILFSEMCRRDENRFKRVRQDIASALAEKHIH